MKPRKKFFIIIGLLIIAALSMTLSCAQKDEKIGVLFVLHGGMDEYVPLNLFDAALHQFAYDPNHPVHSLIMWNSAAWSTVLDSEFSIKFRRKFEFEYERIGGLDPFHALSDIQLADMKAVLDQNPYGLEFEVDFASWMSGDRPEHFPYPRFLQSPPEGGDSVTYCGEQETKSVVLDFTNGGSEFAVGATLTGSTGATAVIDEVTLESGSWAGGDAAGLLALSDIVYATGFCGRSGDACTVDADCGFDLCLGNYFEAGDALSGSSGGRAEAAGTIHWPGCDPDRYNVDGPAERLLAKGVTRILVVDLTVGGVRFYKTFEVIQMTKKVLERWNAEHDTSVPLLWVNDYADLMEDSYPVAPENWTPIMGEPTEDRHVLVQGRPNPLAEDMELAALNLEGIEAGMSSDVSDADTAVLLFNHGLFDPDRRFYDPKIDDSVVLNENIKSLLLEQHPDMDPDNIIGAYGGSREVNPENGIFERTRPMRGEDLAYSYLHETDQDMPGDEWGYRYWDALEYLKDRGVKHIVVGFPQVVTDSVLTMVEYFNQVGKEVGVKTWLRYDEGDNESYPGVGHPFADYWGNWVDTDCGGEPCCFEMGGCDDGREYPPPRQAPLDEDREDMDPSLAYDLSDYGHLGYDPTLGPPDPNGPVQDQYTGTWDMYVTPSDDPRVGELLAKHVLAAVTSPLVYITNGEIENIAAGETVTFKASLAGSNCGHYSYAWFLQEEGSSEWQTVGRNHPAWKWKTARDDAGTYSIRCRVTNAEERTGEVTWKGFVVSDS